MNEKAATSTIGTIHMQSWQLEQLVRTTDPAPTAPMAPTARLLSR